MWRCDPHGKQRYFPFFYHDKLNKTHNSVIGWNIPCMTRANKFYYNNFQLHCHRHVLILRACKKIQQEPRGSTSIPNRNFGPFRKQYMHKVFFKTPLSWWSFNININWGKLKGLMFLCV